VRSTSAKLMFSSCSPFGALLAGVKIGSASFSAWARPGGSFTPQIEPVAW